MSKDVCCADGVECGFTIAVWGAGGVVGVGVLCFHVGRLIGARAA
jgi:hypothetical protein